MVTDYASGAPILRKAADLIDKHGWTTGILVNPDGQRCAMGAIYAADPFAGDDGVWSLADYMHANYERFKVPRPEGDDVSSSATITTWNDFVAQTAEEVISALRDAATWAEGRANA
jgi:hypothetical protein